MKCTKWRLNNSTAHGCFKVTVAQHGATRFEKVGLAPALWG